MGLAAFPVIDTEVSHLNRDFGISDRIHLRRLESDKIAAEIQFNDSRITVIPSDARVTCFAKQNGENVLAELPGTNLSRNISDHGGIEVLPNTSPESIALGLSDSSPWKISRTGTLLDTSIPFISLTRSLNIGSESSLQLLEMKYSITLGASLICTLSLTNQGLESYEIDRSLHTFFRLHQTDISTRYSYAPQETINGIPTELIPPTHGALAVSGVGSRTLLTSSDTIRPISGEFYGIRFGIPPAYMREILFVEVGAENPPKIIECGETKLISQSLRVIG